MIQIYKSEVVPAVLQNEGKAATQTICDLMTQRPDSLCSGKGKSTKSIQRMPFDASIYGHKSVKDQLIADQHGKCCFCESKFRATSAGDVEHARPKGAVLKPGEKSLTFPGYYWLAYEWRNLLLACENCNRRFKRNHYPLMDESVRVRHHVDHPLLALEIPLLINPLEEDAQQYITFEDEVPKPKDQSHRGELSIACYGLCRKPLNDARAEYLEILKLLYESLDFEDVNSDFRRRILDRLNAAMLPTAPYSAMIRANFPVLPTK